MEKRELNEEVTRRRRSAWGFCYFPEPPLHRRPEHLSVGQIRHPSDAGFVEIPRVKHLQTALASVLEQAGGTMGVIVLQRQPHALFAAPCYGLRAQVSKKQRKKVVSEW